MVVGVRLHGLVMAQTQVQSPSSSQTARGGGRKESLVVGEIWKKERWAEPGVKRRNKAPRSSDKGSWEERPHDSGTRREKRELQAQGEAGWWWCSLANRLGR